MLRIQYLDKDRFMQQVAASRGSVLLHLANGETCDLKKDNMNEIRVEASAAAFVSGRCKGRYC